MRPWLAGGDTPPARLRLAAAALAALHVAACASTGARASADETPVQSGQAARVVIPGTATSGVVDVRSTTEDFVRRETLPAAPARAWPAVVAAYADLKLPVTLLAEPSRQIASQGRRFRGSLAGTRLGLYFSCGAGALGGDSADSYELTLDVSTTVAAGADSTGSTVLSVASAIGRPVTTSGEPVRCVSTGRLERKLVLAAAAHLAR